MSVENENTQGKQFYNHILTSAFEMWVAIICAMVISKFPETTVMFMHPKTSHLTIKTFADIQ